MKKVVLLLLVVLMVVTTFVGCSGNNAPKETTSGTTSSEASQTQSAKPVELSILSAGDTWNPDNAYLPLIEKATNTNLNMEVVPNDQYEKKRNVVMASGKAPNIIRIKFQDPMYMTYVQEAMLIPLDEYLNKYLKIKDAYAPEVWKNNVAKDGKIYHLPRIDEELLPNLFMFRKDVLDKLSLARPTTAAELRQVFEALKKQNKDKGYTPYVGNRNDLTDLDPFLFAFGTGFNIWQLSDSGSAKIVYSTTTEKFKNALKFISGLRKDGLFEAEWYVGKNRGIDKFYLGKSEFTMDSPQYVEYRIPEIQNVDKNAVIDYIPFFKGEDGKEYGAKLMINQQDDPPGTAIVKGTSPEQIEAYMNLLSWFYDGEGFKMLKFGVEGKTYDVVDGKIVSRPREENPPEYDMENMDRFDFAYSPIFRNFTRDIIPAAVSDTQFEIARKAIEETYKAPIVDYGSNLNDEVISNNLNNLKSLSEELLTKAILSPNADVDKLFEEYNQKLKQNKLDEVTEAINRLNAPN